VTGLDTNVLVRFFAKDDPQQSPKARNLLSSLTSENPGWVAVATILELVWVMDSKFRIGRSGIALMLGQLLSREEIVVEQAGAVVRAIQTYRNGNADFAGCLIAASARAAGCAQTVTFDRIAARDAGMHLLE
jgi:predicted nucleic-acid-binding protein